MMKLEVQGFDWDEANREKCQIHGLSVSEIEAFFQQESIHVAPDIRHSQQEQRFIAIGKSTEQRPMFVAFTLREKDNTVLIRPISARYMHDREVKKYEQEITRPEE